MGLNKFENEDMLKYGYENDIWFHVDSLSSAHVYLRLQGDWTFDNIPEAVLVDCCQLVKANSIEGNKKANVKIVYTPFNNLKKEQGHDVGQVTFHSTKLLKYVTVEKRINEIVNRLNKTKEEKNINWMEDKARRQQDEKKLRKELFEKRVKNEIYFKDIYNYNYILLSILLDYYYY
jgi:hypothetical protein